MTLPMSSRACAERLADLAPDIGAADIMKVFRVAKLYTLRTLSSACHDRIGGLGKDFLEDDSVIDLLKDDPQLYKEVLNAAWKRRRTGSD